MLSPHQGRHQPRFAPLLTPPAEATRTHSLTSSEYVPMNSRVACGMRLLRTSVRRLVARPVMSCMPGAEGMVDCSGLTELGRLWVAQANGGTMGAGAW